jgi:cellulose biosynthesis protein BcsQ
MNDFATRNLRKLLGSLSFLIVSALLAAGMVVWIVQVQQEAENSLQQARAQLNESRSRLARAQEDEREIRAKIDRYRELIEQGRIQPENRLDWIEALRNVKEKRRLLSMEYEIAPQRPLDPKQPITGGYSFLTSPMKLDMLLLHEYDLLGLLSDLSATVPALISPRKCTIERLPPTAQPQAAQLKASCEIDWITLQEKP